MEDLNDAFIQMLVQDQILNKGFTTAALVQFLAEKGIIDLDEFTEYVNQYARRTVLKMAHDFLKDEL